MYFIPEIKMSETSEISKRYELYEMLERLAEENNRTIDLNSICFTINDISQQMPTEASMEHIYEIGGLIKRYEHQHGGNLVSNMVVSYNGKIMAGGKGLLYVLENLPVLLQQIIAEYLVYYSLQ